MLRLIGLFVPVMREFVEMLYQYDRDYDFNSSKFENEFDFKPTSYEDGISEIIETDYEQNAKPAAVNRAIRKNGNITRHIK